MFVFIRTYKTLVIHRQYKNPEKMYTKYIVNFCLKKNYVFDLKLFSDFLTFLNILMMYWRRMPKQY